MRTVSRDEFIARYEANKAKKAEQRAKATKKGEYGLLPLQGGQVHPQAERKEKA